MPDDVAYLDKADENLAAAESEFAASRYNSCANRCYYACFHAAVAALIRASVRPRNPKGTWDHDFVQAQFSGLLVNRRKLYVAALRDTLSRNQGARNTADYDPRSVTEIETARALRRAREFVAPIRGT